jgi:cytochrome c2
MRTVLATIFAFAFIIASSNMAFADVAKGKKVFSKKCKTCHSTGTKKKMGPGLKGIKDRHSDAWLKKWIANSQKTWAENDKETQELKSRVKKGKTRKKTKMKVKLKAGQVDDVIDYIKTL